MPATKWDAKAERDLFFAMRLAEHGLKPVSKAICKKAGDIMEKMGYPEVATRTISERWYKTLSKTRQLQEFNSLGLSPRGAAPTIPLIPIRRDAPKPKRKRGVKDEKEEEDDVKPVKHEYDTDNSIEVIETPTKKQKQKQDTATRVLDGEA
ncbi:hypothetical protein GGR50DRAFT_694724 [Xylaria sp. CBS 124048]|nr:hypothetical protein GGR50DRAFT_694724 [Xylaria sp. CBS 124048]